MKRGDIYYADLRPVIGSEQGGIRPVLIIQNDTGNKHSPTVICAAITSIIGAAYTSVSFLKTFHHSIADNENYVIIGFIAVSTIIMVLIGKPALLLVLAGALNGLILPITLGICLIASQNKKIMGENYKHPTILLVLGIIVVLISAYLGITTFMSQMSTLFV